MIKPAPVALTLALTSRRFGAFLYWTLVSYPFMLVAALVTISLYTLTWLGPFLYYLPIIMTGAGS